MFNNLIESQSHGKEFKRQGRFLLATSGAYALAFFVIAVGSIYAYDAQLEAQINDLTVLSWVPPVQVTPASQPPRAQPIRRASRTNAPVDNRITVPIRTSAVTTTNNPNLVPKNVGTMATTLPPVTGVFNIGSTNINPPGSGSEGGCPTCTDNSIGTVVHIDEKPPEPVKVVPKTQPLTSIMLRSKAISLPQPQYPAMAKQARVHGPVVIQILVDESGRVVSAQVVSGNPLLTANAREAAMRARFTATTLNGQSVKVQGVITYNFVLQ